MHLQKQLSFWRAAACGECFPPVCLKPFWRISSPFPTSPPFLPEPAIFYHICLPNRCAHVRLSSTTSPISVTSACATGLKAAASSALTLSSRSFPSNCSPLTMQPTALSRRTAGSCYRYRQRRKRLVRSGSNGSGLYSCARFFLHALCRTCCQA